MSDSVRPHRRQPTRLPHPWDSPGKNTGVGCHFLLQCMKVKSASEVAQSCPTLSNPMDCSLPGSSVHGIFQARVPEWGAIVPPFPQLLNGENNTTHHLGLLWILSYQIIHVLRTYNKHSVNISYSYQYVTIIIINYHSCEFKLGNVERQNWLSVGWKMERVKK